MSSDRIKLTNASRKLSERSAKEVKAVEIRAELRQIKTMADGTINITLNLPEDCKPQVKVMLDWLGLEVKAVIEVSDS
jgi:hypothetical protein